VQRNSGLENLIIFLQPTFEFFAYSQKEVSFLTKARINYNYHFSIDSIMTSENEQKDGISNPFLNPMGYWQSYFLSWIEASRGFYENTLRANEQWFKTLWDLWLRSSGIEQKETTKVE